MRSNSGKKKLTTCSIMLVIAVLVLMASFLINGKQVYELFHENSVQKLPETSVVVKSSTNEMTAKAVGGTILSTVYYGNVDNTARSFFSVSMGGFDIPGFFNRLDSVSGSMSNVVATCTMPIRATNLEAYSNVAVSERGADVKFYETRSSMARMLLSASITCLQTYFNDITKTSKSDGCDFLAEEEMAALCKLFVDKRTEITKFAESLLLLTSVNLDN